MAELVRPTGQRQQQDVPTADGRLPKRWSVPRNSVLWEEEEKEKDSSFSPTQPSLAQYF